MFLRLKRLRECVAALLVCVLGAGAGYAGIIVTGTDGIIVTGTDGVSLAGVDGIRAVGTDGLLAFGVNGIIVTGTDGVASTGADGVTYTAANVLSARGVDTLTAARADGIIVTGTDGIIVTGTDGVARTVDSLSIARADGIIVTGTDGIIVTGTDGIIVTGTDGAVFQMASGALNIAGADGIIVTGTDGVSLGGIDAVTYTDPNGIIVTGTDGIIVTGTDGIIVTGTDGEERTGLRSVDPELALLLERLTDDSNVNAAVVYHRATTDSDLEDLRRVGILGGTRYRALPVISVTATRRQLTEVSRLPAVRSIYGNRTLQLVADPYRAQAGADRVARDTELTSHNSGLPVTGRGVAVAVLDTGLDATHADLAGRVTENVKVVDTLSLPVGFAPPAALSGLPNTDLVHGHGTFVGGLIAGDGSRSNGAYGGVAPGANLVGVSAGELSLLNVVAGFDYLLSHPELNVRVVNCSFSAAAVFDENDPVNVATRMLTDRGVSVVFSAGNTGPGLHTLNPYAAAPWVVSVGATDRQGRLSDFSARGDFGSRTFRPTLVAPGVDLVSLRSSGVNVVGTTGLLSKDTARLSAAELAYYTTATGTSFSAPQVAGVIALMLEANPRLTPAQIKDILQRTATPLPPYYAHEVGAGMLNAHAAVLEAAFPARRMGQFRTAAGASGVRFVADPLQTSAGTVANASGYEAKISVPENTLVASVQIGWGPIWSLNDLGMALYDAQGVKRADVNTLNLPGLSGKRERALLAQPAAGEWRVAIKNTLVAAVTQEVAVAAEIMRAEYPKLGDTTTLSAPEREDVKRALRTFVLAPSGENFRPAFAVTRAELAASLVAGGRVPQYLPGSPNYKDVRDLTTMLAVESAQAHPAGALFPDSQPGGYFRPNAFVDRLTAAVVLVRAAGLESEAAAYGGGPLSILDANGVPSPLRGYVHVAVSRGLLSTDHLNFRPQSTLTRLELACASAVLQDLLAK